VIVGVTEGRAPAPGKAGPLLDKATLAEVRKLQEERRELLREALELREKLYRSGRATMGEVIGTSKRWLTAELDLAATAAERIAAHERHLEKAQALVEYAKARQAAARGTHVEVLDAQEYCLEAKIGLLKSGGKVKKAKK
jgi:outer membrane protein TolC